MAEQLLNARYRVLRPLGTGGMASVYLAEDLRLGRRVAVKILHPQFAADPTFVARFEQEARLAASLSHPNIVRVYDVGHDGDRHYIVMEYVEGETLKDTIARQGALPVTRALEIIGGVLAALEVAHTHNLIHRDIKAQNILITPDGDVKVTDFGIARELGGLTAPTLTATGMVMGTAQYFAPEQAQGRPATQQSDVYAAGIVLFEMLTGQLPFDGENPLGVAMQQINQPPPLPSSINRAIPPAVEAIVLKALAKNPAERYASAAAMKAAADAARTGAASPTRLAPRVAPPTPTTAAPVPPPGVIRQTTRPTPVVATAPPAPATGRATQRLLWIVAAALIALAAFAAARYIANGSLGFGGGATATPTATVTASPSATLTPAPSPTRRPVVVPSATATRPAPTATETPAPSATATEASPSPTVTDTPLPPTATPVPSDTPSPSPTDTPAPSPTPPAATDTPQPSPTTQTTPTATAGPATLQLAPATAHPGDAVVVNGSGWPANAVVSLSTDYTTSQQVIGQATAGPDGTFSTQLTIPSDVAAGTYTIKADDGRGDTTSQTLTVTP